MKITLTAVLAAILFCSPASADYINWMPDAPHIDGYAKILNYYDPNTNVETHSGSNSKSRHQQYAFQAFNTDLSDITVDIPMFFTYGYAYDILITNMAGLNDYMSDILRFEAIVSDSSGEIDSIDAELHVDLDTSSSNSFTEVLSLSLPESGSYFLDIYFYTHMMIDSVTAAEGIPDMPDPGSPMGYTNYLSTELAVTADTTAPIPEPTSILLIGAGLAGLYSRRRFSNFK